MVLLRCGKRQLKGRNGHGSHYSGSGSERTVTLSRPDNVNFAIDDIFSGWETVDYPNFLSDYRFALPYCSNDCNREVLSGVCFHRSGTVVATDGRCLVAKENAHNLKYQVQTVDEECDIIVKDTKWLRRIKKVDGVQASDGWFRVRSGDWQYAVKLGQWPR
jgi:hypothetical protein